MLEQLRSGQTNGEIAEALDLSVNTVRYHLTNILGKLELDDREALRAWNGTPERRHRRLSGLGWLGSSSLLRVGAGTAAAVLAAVGVSIAGSDHPIAGNAGRSLEEPSTAVAASSSEPTAEVGPTTAAEPTVTAVPIASGTSAGETPVQLLARVAAEFVDICHVVDPDARAIPLSEHFPDPPNVPLIGALYAVSADGCVTHPPALEWARQTQTIADEDAAYIHVTCFLWPAQTDPAVGSLMVTVGPYHGPGDTDPGSLQRIADAPEDGLVLADCGIGLGNVDRFDNDSTRRWLPD